MSDIFPAPTSGSVITLNTEYKKLNASQANSPKLNSNN